MTKTNMKKDMTNEKQRAFPQLCSKPFEEMDLLELYAERACHAWHRTRMGSAIYGLMKKKVYLEANHPIYSVEEINRQYEAGEMTKNEYKTAFATRKNRINGRMRNSDYIEYAKILEYNETAIVAYLDELIARKLSSQQVRTSPNSKKYDPRKRDSVNNQRKWSTRVDKSELPKLKAARRRWKEARSREADYIDNKRTAVIKWDIDKLYQIARDRGYYTDMAVSAVIADTLHITIYAARRLMNSGKFTWGQCIVIGSLFEMTPKEFCDVFLSGYFKDYGSGVYKAHVDDVTALLDVPYNPKPITETKGETDGTDIQSTDE